MGSRHEGSVVFVGERPETNLSGDGAVQFEKNGRHFVTSIAHGIIGFSKDLIRFARRKRTKIRTNHHKNRPTV